MTDYKNLKLIASSSPHIRAKEDTRSIMLDVIIALLPALVFSIYNFGFRALIEVLVSVAACVFWEWGYRKVMKKPQMVGDFSAIVTGILLAFVCPVTLPWWTLVIGAFFSIVVVKQLYGGIGCNFLNPALAGRAILLASYATAMTTWVKAGEKLSAFGANADVATAATPLAIMKEGTFDALTSTYTVTDLFLGKIGGSLGETSALMLLFGFAYLLVRKVISWHTPVAYIGTVAVICLISAPAGIGAGTYMLYNLFSGGLMLGAIFMATDYATSPVTKKGQLIFGIGCGLITVFIRYSGHAGQQGNDQVHRNADVGAGERLHPVGRNGVDHGGDHAEHHGAQHAANGSLHGLFGADHGAEFVLAKGSACKVCRSQCIYGCRNNQRTNGCNRIL